MIFRSSIFFNSKTSEDKDESIPFNVRKKYSVVLHSKQSKSFTKKIQEPILSLGNLFKKKVILNEGKEEKNNNNNENTNSNSNKKIDTTNTNKTKSNENEITIDDNNNNNNYLDLDSYFDEHFKIFYITPIILELTSNLFYENINM